MAAAVEGLRVECACACVSERKGSGSGGTCACAFYCVRAGRCMRACVNGSWNGSRRWRKGGGLGRRGERLGRNAGAGVGRGQARARWCRESGNGCAGQGAGARCVLGRF